ncbi:MAG: MBL fold metallo-hydrolase, partial [Pseudomonadales bacterium]|nr:MBL fold metallo-hydrolase [Pseudomonadales bacterium]
MKFRQPTDQELWFLPLGGSGEIGMNLNLFGHDDSWLMVDCGITFERQASGDNQIEMPDPDGAPQALQSLVGIIATHAHEDHIGALPHLYKRFPKPIYT